MKGYGMVNIAYDYCGDGQMADFLERAGARLSLSQIYGLFYGCLASPHVVETSQYMPLIFGDDKGPLDALEETTSVLGNLMPLWNLIAGWNAEKEPFYFPDVHYPHSRGGIMKRIEDDCALIEYFIKGLDMGHVAEADFSKGGMESLKSLSETSMFLSKYSELLENEEGRESVQVQKVLEAIQELEHMAGDCIAGLNLSLKKARIRESEQMQILMAPDIMMQDTAPCPCGSGKKYGKCCGLFH
jgi:hypothetical protein